MHKLVAPFDFAVGAYARRWRAPSFRGCSLVVVYHRVAPPAGRGDAAGFGVERGLPVDVFEAQLRFLLEHFRPARAIDLLAPETGVPGVRFSISFDDGYRDNLTLAAPVLTRLGVPATLFLSTDFVGTERLFWWEQLGELIRATRATRLTLQEIAPGLGARWPLPPQLALGDARARERAHRLLSLALMRTPPVEVDAVLARLAYALGVPRREEGRAAPLLDWDDVRRWCTAGLDVGAHGASHANLGLVSEEEARAEIVGSLAAIQRETGPRPVLFAYPYGGPEHRSPAAMSAVAASGCPAAFTTEPGLVGPRADRLALPRIGLASASRLKCAYHVDLAFDAARAG